MNPGGTARHLILIGLPGVGKSTAGVAVARRLARQFIDFDVEIERREGLSVAEIFARRGEPYFRELERTLTLELLQKGSAVAAPGGGWAANPDLVALVRPTASIIYLRARPETALRRLGSDRRTRPLLLGEDPLGALERLLAARRAAYEAADFVIDTDLLDPQQLTDQIAEVASASGGG